MKFSGGIGIFAICLLIGSVIEDAEGVRCTSDKRYGYLKTQFCYGVSSYCCPYLIYSRSYYGTTFKTCCVKSEYSKIFTYYCSNFYARRLYCKDSSRHCCSSKIYSGGRSLSSCCSLSTKTVSRTSCSYTKGWNKYQTCYLPYSTRCCNSINTIGDVDTYSSCCDAKTYYAPMTICRNRYEKYWCRSPSNSCCSTATYLSGSYLNGCCYSISDRYPYTPEKRHSDVGAIVGGVIGGVVLIVIIGVVVGVVCSRKTRPATSGNTAMAMTGGVNQGTGQGYPRQQVVVAYSQQAVVPGHGQPLPYGVNPAPPVMYAGAAPFPAPPIGGPPMPVAPVAAGAQPVETGTTPSGNIAAPPPAYDNIAFESPK